MRYLIRILGIISVLIFLAAPSVAAPKVGYFWAEIGEKGTNGAWNQNFSGGGDGYTNSGPWYSYPSESPQSDPWGGVNPVPAWVNQWYYDDPLYLDRWKQVSLNFNYGLNNPLAAGGALIVINWSTDAWSDETAPPMTNRDLTGQLLVGRQEVGSLWLEANNQNTYNFSETYDLRDYGVNYNPVWISIDVSGYNFNLSSQSLPGSIIHECIPTPEPSLTLLLGLGLVSIVLLRRKFINSFG